VLVILAIGVLLALPAGSHVDRATGRTVNNFLNAYTLLQTATNASFFAAMAVGATAVIISDGIDLSVGSVYALSGVTTALMLRAAGDLSPGVITLLAASVCLGIGALCGLRRACWCPTR
jgi:ribose/xylose/arabinose/galactoside ABC-type transport system permease subunit